MAEGFTPITIESQEQLDGMFKDRINRQNEKHSKELAEKLGEVKSDYESKLAEVNEELAKAKEVASGYDSIIAEKDAKIHEYELASVKSQVALEMGLTHDAVKFLQGDNEESIRSSAEALKSLVKVTPAPMAREEAVGGNSEQASYREMLNNLKFN